MTVDRELHDRLSRLRDAHQPDRERIRARFEAGIAAGVEPALPAAAGRPARAWGGLPVRAAAVVLAVGLAATGVVVANRDRPASVAAGGTAATDGAAATGGVAPPYVPPTTPAPAAGPAPEPSSLPPGTAVATTGPVGPGPAEADPGTTVAGGAPPSGVTATTVGAPSASPTTAAPAGSSLCRHKDELDLGHLHLINDLWGAGQASSGSQCVTVTSGSVAADGTGLAWSTRWSWAGAPGQPKSFSNVYLGWDWGWKEPDSGLPRRMADGPGIRSSWEFTVSTETPGRMEVAYDLWFHDRPDPAGDTLPVSEVRIILYRTPMDLPASGRQGTVTLEGGTWDVYRFGNEWDVVTFYRTASTTRADVDLGRFLDEAARYTRLPWLTSIHAGVGVNDGAGQVDTTRFSLSLS